MLLWLEEHWNEGSQESFMTGSLWLQFGFGADVRRPVGDYASSASGLRMV